MKRPALTDTVKTAWWERWIEASIRLLALSAIASIVLIFLFIGREALPLLWETTEDVSFGRLFFAQTYQCYDEPGFFWQPVGYPPKYNVIPLFVGTLKVTVLSMLVSVPLGIGCAIYSSEYAPRQVREVLKPTIELLAAIPSVVLGLFALMLLASVFRDLFGWTYRLNGFVAAMGLSLTIVPVIYTVAEDALRAVPSHLREASLALGARRWQTAWNVVLPAAIPGLTAAVVLGFGRAIGETMIVLMASGNASVVDLFNPTTSVRTVTA